jgi:hypothetical protein
MQRAIIVRGRLIDGRTIQLDEPVHGVDEEVDVVLRESLPTASADTGESLVAVLHRDDIDRAMRGGDIELEVLRAPAPVTAEEYTESPVVLARRASATIPAGPPVPEDTPRSNG